MDWPDEKPAEYERLQTKIAKQKGSAQSALVTEVQMLREIVTKLSTDISVPTIQNHSNNNVTINGDVNITCFFGNEDTSHITRHDIANLVNTLPVTKVLPGVVDLIYFDENGKNTTFVLPPAGDNVAFVRQINGWASMPVDKVISQVTYKGVDVMQKSVDDKSDKYIGELVPPEKLDEYDDHCCDMYNAGILLHLKDPDVVESRKQTYEYIRDHLQNKDIEITCKLRKAK